MSQPLHIDWVAESADGGSYGAGDDGRRGEERTLRVSGPSEVVERIARIVHQLAEREAETEDLISVMLEHAEGLTPGEERLGQVRRQAEARASFLNDVPLLSSTEVGELLGSTAQNKAAMANRYKHEGKIFAVSHRGADHYPAFQFQDGDALPVVGEIISRFEGVSSSSWQMALWFASPSGWLDGRRPMDVVEDEPEAVLEAARRAVEPLSV